MNLTTFKVHADRLNLGATVYLGTRQTPQGDHNIMARVLDTASEGSFTVLVLEDTVTKQQEVLAVSNGQVFNRL